MLFGRFEDKIDFSIDFGPTCLHFGRIFGLLGKVLEASWPVLEASRALLEASWRILDASWGVLEASCCGKVVLKPPGGPRST